MTRSTYGNGVVTDHAYNADNTLTSITHSGTGSAIGDYSYTWDANKNKLSETITGVMSGYGFDNTGYDSEDRLTAWNRDDNSLAQSWNLSPVGDWSSITENGTVQSRTHGPTRELLTADSQSVTHDVKGNMTLIPAALRPDGNALSLVWDQDNKMSTTTTNGVTVTQRFDALGCRVARNNDIYVQAGQQTVADYASGTTPTTPEYTYVYASYIDEPVMRAGGSDNLYFHRNQQYSIVALTDSTGGIKERYSYDAYGTLTITDANGVVQTSSAETNRYTFTGREWDETLDVYHFRARMYHSRSGRFFGRDPLQYVDGESIYRAYFILDSTDPSGQFEGAHYRCPSQIAYMRHRDHPRPTPKPAPRPPQNPAPKIPPNTGGCTGTCIGGNMTKTGNCNITTLTVNPGSDGTCNLMTRGICDEIKKMIGAANKKFPGKPWKLNFCSKGCSCGAGPPLTPAPTTIQLNKFRIKSTGEVEVPFIGTMTIACDVTVTGTISVTGGSIGFSPCNAKKAGGGNGN